MAQRGGTRIKEGDTAEASLQNLRTISELSDMVGNPGALAGWKVSFGPIATALKLDIENLAPLQQWDALVKRMAPQMRAPGSGSTSDIEHKAMIAALPTASQDPIARGAIISTMQRDARFAIAKRDLTLARINKNKAGIEAAEEQLAAIKAEPSPWAVYRKQGRGGAMPKPAGTPTWRRLSDANP